jgi:anthranilate 1,2-dioxygenase small subunit
MGDDSARRQIEDLIHDYAHCIDDDRLEEWPDFFTEKCLYRIVSRDDHARGLPVGVMTCSSRGMLQDRILSLRNANIYEPHVYRHLISAIRIRGETGGEWSVQTGYAVIRTMQTGDVSIFSTGKYLDRIVREGDALKFRERTVVFDSRRVHTLMVIPI